MLYFTENSLTQESPSGSKTWSLQELLETPNPLPGLPLVDRNAALRKAAEMAEKNVAALSETALLQVDFWKNFQAAKISECTYIYPSATNSTHRWELTINGLGLLYKDISGEYYYPPGHVSEQLFSDFWFYGPLQPIPELSMREKMDLAETMLKADSNSEKGAEVLISLLEYEAEESYWRNYVFNYCFKLRGNKKVENFIIDCLQGDNEIHFKKAVDVLQMWGFYGDKSLQDRALLLQLNWEDATANDPEFREAIEKIIRIVRK